MTAADGLASWDVAAELPKISSEREEWWENHGWCLRGAEPDRDFEIFTWSAFYLLRGGPQSWVIPSEGLVRQTVVVAGDFPERDSMQDNTFWVRGSSWDEIEALSALAVEHGDAGVWRGEGIEHWNRPPTWRVANQLGPIRSRFDLRLGGGPFLFGDFGNTGGAEVLAGMSGVVEHHEQVHDVVGFGQHERAYTPNVAGVSRANGGWLTEPQQRRHLWHCGATDDGLRVTFLVNQPAEDPETINAHLVLPTGAELDIARHNLDVRERQTWLDPRSGVTVPSAWEVSIERGDVLVNYRAQAFARAYYLWDYVRGYIGLLYWMVAEAAGSWSDGRAGGAFSRMPYVAHTHRPMFANPLHRPAAGETSR